MGTDIHRPELHVTAETGVLNAPAGIICDHGTWHMYYQFQPKVDSPSRWGHTYAADGPFEWTVCDDVLAPQGDETTLRAGSVVSESHGAEIYFTSVTAEGTSIQIAHVPSVEDTCEVSDDPSSLNDTTVRGGEVVSDRDGFTRFRSPCVVPDWRKETDREAGHQGWLMLAVTGSVDHPTPVILTSDDGKDWQLQGPLTVSGDLGLESVGAMTAPRIMRLRDEVDDTIYDILLVTLERDGIDHSGYLVGTLQGTEFEITRGFTRIDYGHDFVRPRSSAFTPGTIAEDQRFEEGTLFGLMNGVGRQDDPTTHASLKHGKWVNALSLPRVVTLQGGVLYQTPKAGLIDAVANSKRARSWTGLCEIPVESSLTVELYNGQGNIAATITHAGNTLTLDRSMNPHHPDSEPAVAPLQDDDTDSLTIVVDGSTVEVFADGGQVAMSSRVYFDDGCSHITATPAGSAEILRSWQQSGSLAN